MKELTVNIDLDHEVAAVASFIGEKWTAINNVQQLVADIRRYAERHARTLFDHYPLWERAKALYEERKALLLVTTNIRERVGVEYHDALCTLLYDVKWNSADISKAGQAMLGAWDLSARSKKLLASLEEHYPDLAHTRPRDWADAESSRDDITLMRKYDPQRDRDAFHGSCMQGTLSDELPVRIALPHVFVTENTQRLNAPAQLVAAILAHFMGITQFLNSFRLADALPAALPQLHEPRVLFERDVRTDNPFLRVAFETASPCSTPEALATAIRKLAEFDALSDDEKARRAAARNKTAEDIIVEVTRNSAEADKKHAAEMERYSVLLSKALEA